MAAGQTQADRSREHRAAQAAIGSAAAAALSHAWVGLFDLHDLRGSQQRLSVSLTALVKHYGQSAGAVALRQYRTDRRAANAPGAFSPKMPPLPSATTIDQTVEKALAPLYGTPDAAQVVNAEKALESSLEQLVLDQGRQAVIDAVHDDREAIGWARVTEPGACYFCAMLASRGMVYKSRETASFRAHRRYPNGTGGDCRCHAEPVFNAYEPTAEIRQWQADYQKLKADLGRSPSLLEWRRRFEGRDVKTSSSPADA